MIKRTRVWGFNESEHFDVQLQAIPETPGTQASAAVPEGPRLVEEEEVGSLGLAPNASCDQGILLFIGSP